MPGAKGGDGYKFHIRGADGDWRDKADPMAYFTEIPPATASRIFDSTHRWTDDEWMTHARPRTAPDQQPMSVYEVHLGSWRRHPGAGPYSYDDLVEHLVPVRRRDGLHPRRVPARDGAPVRWLVGLPGHVVLRADLALRRPRRLPTARRGAAQRRHRRDRRLGARALPQGRLRARPVRRHRRSTRTRTRAAASTPTGAPTSSTSGARRSATSWSPTRCTGSRSSTSTASASTPWPR